MIQQYVSLTTAQKTALFKKKTNNPRLTNAQLSAWAKDEFKLEKPPNITTISKLLKRAREDKEDYTFQWKKKQRGCAHAKLEEALALWIQVAEQNNIQMKWDMIKKAGQKIADKLQIPENERIKFSNGWQHRFQKRYSIGVHRIHGEAGAVDEEAITTSIASIRRKIASYHPCDVYNIDETALYYSEPPATTISSAPILGRKADKSRLTIAITVNSDDSDVRHPLIIGKHEKPRCFGGKPAHLLGFHQYFFNSTSWMTGDIFRMYLMRFDDSMREKGRKVLLLLDNFSGHRCQYNTTNVELLYLPANTTAKLQPLDAGIIRTFKAHYRNLQYERAYNAITLKVRGLQPVENPFKVDQRHAMKWIVMALKKVTKQTIQNCWRKMKLIGDGEVSRISEPEECEAVKEQLMLHCQGIYGPDVAGKVDIDLEPVEERKATRPQSEDDIIDILLLEKEIDATEKEARQEDKRDDDDCVVKLSTKEKLTKVNEVIFFLDDDTHGELKNQLRDLRDELHRECLQNQTQSLITSHFSKQ